MKLRVNAAVIANRYEKKQALRAEAPTLGTIQRSTGVHDELFTRALVLNDGRQRVAIACLDLIGMDFMLADEICAAVRERTGISVTLLNSVFAVHDLLECVGMAMVVRLGEALARSACADCRRADSPRG